MYISVSDKAPETAAQSVQKAPSKTNEAQRALAQTAKQPASAASKTPASAPRQAAARSASSMVSAAGLPADKLSASIISFARFFSLPLKPEVLKHIRQQAFSMTPNAGSSEPIPEDGAPEARTVLKTREALSIAASAAESKGVELQPKGLEAYAKAMDPESRQDDEHGDRRGRRKKNDDDNDFETSSKKTAAISAGSLEKAALEAAERNTLLATLNRLPGKDGKRWIVLPFDFCDNGREFKVTLRILLETGKTVNRAACMELDIAIRGITGNGGTEKHRLFVFEPANRLSVYLRPEIEPAQEAAFIRGLSALLEISPDRIFIKTKTESFPFEADCGEDLLGSIDEAV